MPVRSLAQIRDLPRPPWIWEGFIAPSNFTLFSAYPKVGKTTLVWHVIRALMLEEACLERVTRRVPILYISEEPARLLADRAAYLGYQDDWPIGILTREPGMTWERCILYMKRWVHVHGNPLIITDTLARFWSAADENNATQVDHALNPVLELVRNSEAAFMGIHHNRKQGGGGGMGVRGSTALTGGVDVIMELTRLSNYDHGNVRRLNCESRYSETPDVLQLRLEEGGYIVEDEETVEVEPTIVSILQTMECLPAGDFVTLSGRSESAVRKALTSLGNRGIIIRSGRGTSGSPYLYSLNNSTAES